MKQKRSGLWLLRSMVSTMAVLALAAGAMAAARPIPERVALSPVYAGEAIFRGVAFGEGEVAARLASPQTDAMAAARDRLSDTQRQLLHAVEDSITKRIAAVDPTFFARYGADMQSGDPVRIAGAMERARELVKEVTRPGQNRPTIDQSQQGCLLVVLAVGVFVINVAVALNFDIAMNFVTAANIVSVENEVYQTDASNTTQLQRDQFVFLVAARLAA